MLVSFTFKPSEKPWSTNQDRNLNPHVRHKLIKVWKEDALVHYRQYCNRVHRHRALPPGSVSLSIPFRRTPSGDPHNYCGTVLKAVIDGLVTAGAWPDDAPQYVGHTEPILIKGDLCVVEIRSLSGS